MSVPAKPLQFSDGWPSTSQLIKIVEKEDKQDPETDIKSTSQQPAKDIQASPSKAPPSTPATRLPLADLIGDIDRSNCRNNTNDESPEDHINWAVRSPRAKNSAITPAAKSRKRAHSSSPPSTSQRMSTKRSKIAIQDSLNLQGLQSALKTPQTDPSTDLWHRYAVASGKDTPFALQSLPLIISSSPNAADGNVSGLRRWTSCGVEWPTSNPKRRKTRRTDAESLNDSFTEEPAEGAVQHKQEQQASRIGNLLDRIQESMIRSKEALQSKAPSSSSPLLGRQKQFDRHSISPCRASELAEHANTAYRHPIQQLTADAPLVGSDSSFGSDGIDLELLEAVVVDAVPMKPETELVQPVDAEDNDVSKPTDDATRNSTLVDEEDYGDDEDFSAVDFDIIASTCKGSATPKNDHQRLGVVKTIATIEESLEGADEFADDELDEESFAAAEASATQSLRLPEIQRPSSDRGSGAIQRYRIVTVAQGSFQDNKGRRCPEKVLIVEDDKTKLNKVITLRQSWFDTRCTKGSFVHVIGEFSKAGQCVVDDSKNMLILHPDHLISALVVADSFGCIRRAVLQDRVKATSEASPPMTYGTMLHEIFQEALTANRWDLTFLSDTIQKCIARHIEDLYLIKLSVEQVVDHLLSKMPELQSWAEIFVKAKPGNEAIVKETNGKQAIMSVNKLLDVEEHIWSPMFGLKGNIDATVQVTMQDEEGERTLTVPFEIKTGRNSTSASHRAQTALYTLLLSDRYDIAVAYGILYYTETSDTSRIPAMRHELRHMIMQRNELACYVRERLSLPPMLQDPHQCNRCYAKTSCFLYHRLFENGDGETSGLRAKFDQVVQHLEPMHQEFFKKWDDLLTKEESEMMKFRRELWTMLSHEREKLGRCFANVMLEPGSASGQAGSSKINRFQYSFRKFNNATAFSFEESQIVVGEPIVISDEKGHYALAKGYVTIISKKRISVAVDRRLHNARIRQDGFNEDGNQVFAGVMDVSGNPAKILEQSAPMLYRLDKDEFSNGMATVRNNLIQIMTKDAFHAVDIRRLVVEGRAPRFKTTSSTYELSGPLSQMHINGDQKAAIEKIMTAEDYALVLGMPGTGKTTTIAHIIRALVAKKKSVLLASYTHTAVDNILLKIRQDNIGILRLGALAKIHPEVREFATLAAEPRTSLEELQKAYHEPQVVATTCLGITHQLFNERTFDYCIVDEASQITLPVCLGPLRMARIFVLVGDHYQLPPLVQNREAQEGGLDVSLFKLLSENHPEAVATLHHQYRMNSAIMTLSNELIYSGRLICGSAEVESRMLEISSYDPLSTLHVASSSLSPIQGQVCESHKSPDCWLYSVLGPTSPPVIFLNTDSALPASREETNGGSRTTNPFEVSITIQLVRALLLLGVSPISIGVITLYRSQLALIKTLLASHAAASAIEAHTTDRFQGRDKDIILLSCVRNNDRAAVGDLLKDWRRVNVALTRARRKLVIIGSASTLSADPLLARLVRLCSQREWLRDVKAGAAAETAHNWGPRAVLTQSQIGTHQAEPEKVVAPTIMNRAPLAQTSGNTVSSRPRQRPFKAPKKVGKVTAKAVVGSENISSKMPVVGNMMAEILDDVL